MERIMVTILIGVAVVVVLIVVYFVVSAFLTSQAEKEKQTFFNKMQSVLRTNLFPLGFEEKRGAESRDKDGRYRSNVYYSRGKTLVHLRMDTADSMYYLAATRKLGYGDDFLIEGNLDQAEKFKSESIEKLKEWIFSKGIQ